MRTEHEWATSTLKTEVGKGNWTQGTNGRGELQPGGVDHAREPIGGKAEIGFCLHCNAWRGVLGLEPTPELFVKHIVEVFREVRRVLRKDGTCWVNLGDSYAQGSKGNSGAIRPGDKQGTNTGSLAVRRGEALGPNRNGGTNGFCKPKDLVGIPWRVAFALQADGWWLRQDIIWDKGNPMPESVRDRCCKSHEYIFLLTKSQRYYFDWQAIAEPVVDAEAIKLYDSSYGEQRIFQEMEEVSQGISIGSGSAIQAQFARDGQDSDLQQEQSHESGTSSVGSVTSRSSVSQEVPQKRQKKESAPTILRERQGPQNDQAVSGDGEPLSFKGSKFNTGKTAKHQLNRSSDKPRIHGNLPGRDDGGAACNKPGQEKRTKRSVWHVNSQPYPEAHFATFPEDLIKPCILAGAPPGGVVFDPFGGSMTTVKVAQDLGRIGIGLDLKRDYLKMGRRRAAQYGLILSSTAQGGIK